jgi:hypothetical protein
MRHAGVRRSRRTGAAVRTLPVVRTGPTTPRWPRALSMSRSTSGARRKGCWWPVTGPGPAGARPGPAGAGPSAASYSNPRRRPRWHGKAVQPVAPSHLTLAIFRSAAPGSAVRADHPGRTAAVGAGRRGPLPCGSGAGRAQERPCRRGHQPPARRRHCRVDERLAGRPPDREHRGGLVLRCAAEHGDRGRGVHAYLAACANVRPAPERPDRLQPHWPGGVLALSGGTAQDAARIPRHHGRDDPAVLRRAGKQGRRPVRVAALSARCLVPVGGRGVWRAAAPAAATGGSLALPCRDFGRRARHRESLPA